MPTSGAVLLRSGCARAPPVTAAPGLLPSVPARSGAAQRLIDGLVLCHWNPSHENTSARPAPRRGLAVGCQQQEHAVAKLERSKILVFC